MPNGFGFPTYPQAPSPSPQQVGAALAQARMAPAPPASVADPAGATLPSVPGLPDRLHQLFRTLSEKAGQETGGAGQSGTGSAPPGDPDYETSDDEAHSAMHAALGDAAVRIANGVMANTNVGAAQRERRRAHLERLGIAPFEADLLARSGGI